MDYIIEYEVCSLLFLLVITARFFVVRRFPNAQNRLFGVILLCAVADLGLDILGVFTVTHINALPAWAAGLVNTLFYLLQAALPTLLMSYVALIAGLFEGPERRRLPLFFLPAALIVIILLSNPFTGLVFTIEGAKGARQYVQHGGVTLLYLGCLFYLAVTAFFVLHYRRRLRPKQFGTILCFIALVVAALAVQFLYPPLILTGLAITVAILLMFFTLQNPEDMLDLTSGVFNYSAMTVFLQSRIDRARPLYLIALDVGGIRRVNSAFGIQAGNQLLHDVGGFLNGLSGENWVFRMIGTRFLVAAENEEAYRYTLSAAQARFAQPWAVGGNSIRLLATLRCYSGQAAVAGVDDVVTLIDMAYAEIPASGWGTLAYIDPESLKRGRRRMAVEEALRAALRDGRGFELWYQPIYCPGSGCFSSIEALLRFHAPELGEVPPGEFIAIAEQDGLILQIDQMVLRLACAFLRRNPGLRAAGVNTMEINLSAAEYFGSAQAWINETVAQSGLPASLFCFEITETIAVSSRGGIAVFMERMLQDGYSFALDDFGTGYANLSRVVNLPFSIVKLDRTLLTAEKEQNRVVFDDLLGMFSKLGKKIVVEGVETEEQVRRVIRLGADYLQGYYFARPMPEAQLLAFLEQGAQPLSRRAR